MNPNSFISKSANPVSNNVANYSLRFVDRQPVLHDIILWYGKQDAVSEYGSSFGYKIIDSIQDNSNLLQVKALILRDASLSLYLNQINFAVNYDIPVIWIHSHLIPHDWMWSFKFCCVGKVEVVNLWRHICELIG